MRKRSRWRRQWSPAGATGCSIVSSGGSCTCPSSTPRIPPCRNARLRCSGRWPPRPGNRATWNGRRSTRRSSAASAAFPIATRFSAARRRPRSSRSCASPARRSDGPGGPRRYNRRVETIELGLALFLAVAAIGALARWTPLPLPMLLVIGGASLSFLPGLADVELDPDVFFLLFVPLLLFGDGWQFPKREFVSYLRPILLLALGLVAATVAVVGYLMHWLIPSLPLAAAFALGAIVSPTDAVATAAMTARLPLPSRVTHILNGESLINDASGLVAFKFAVAAAATGVFSLSEAGVELAKVAVGGLAAGLVVAWAIGKLHGGLNRVCVDDPTIHTVLSLLSPFAAYLAAERLGLSGILAIVAAGVYGGWYDARTMQ